MKAYVQKFEKTAGWSWVLAGVLAASQLGGTSVEGQASQSRSATAMVAAEDDAAAAASGSGDSKLTGIVIKAIEPTDPEEWAVRKELPWLGVSTEEASEALTSQLRLDPGVGLVVTYVATNSPAAKAGLLKNDLLVEFEGQLLVHPAQLRKLVQTRKEGDTIKLVFYRAGKKQTVSATLAKTAAGFGLLEDEHAWKGDLRELQRQLRELPVRDAILAQMKTLRESLGHVQIDHKKVQEQVHRSMEEARKAYHEALLHASNAASALGPVRKALDDLAKSEVVVDKNATVTVRSTGSAVKSVVKADESGTIVIVNQPKLQLTAHDKDGKLLFDGEIETPEQRAKVPPDLWNKVEPLLDKMTDEP